MTSPFGLPAQPRPRGGPSMTPQGQAAPPYLEARSATPQGSQPIVTPRSSVVPGEVAGQGTPPGGLPTAGQPSGQPGISPTPQAPPENPTKPAGPPPTESLNDVYSFFKTDLQNEQKKALANTTTDAARRGVFYGTPLTSSEGDINNTYLRGLGQLQASMYSGQQNNELQRLAIAASLIPQGGGTGMFNSDIFTLLGGQLGLPSNANAPLPGTQGGVSTGGAPFVTPRGNQTQSQGR